MRAVLASARWRRRFAWAGAGLVVAAAVAAVIVVTWTPDDEVPPAERGGAVAPEEPEPQAVAFESRRRAALDVAARFVGTAVARRHVERSWELVAPSLRRGFTRSSWAKGDIPVVPYPVGQARWRLTYSYVNEVGLQVALFPRRRSRVDPAVFELALRRFRRQGEPRWLVESFTPSAIPSGAARPQTGGFQGLARLEREPSGRSAASATWLLAPFAILGLVVATAIGLGLRGWIRGRRAVRVHERQMSRTRPS